MVRVVSCLYFIILDCGNENGCCCGCFCCLWELLVGGLDLKGWILFLGFRWVGWSGGLLCGIGWGYCWCEYRSG